VILLQAAPPSIAVTDQGFLVFCGILLAIFGVEFRMIQQHRDQFVEFRATVLAELRLMQVKSERASQVGVINALDILSDPNPWTESEMAIRGRMRHNPSFEGISDEEIETVIRRLDAEIAEGHLTGDKLTAGFFMLRELNGELRRREVERELVGPVPKRARWPWSRVA
jgi:hypothetical protein